MFPFDEILKILKEIKTELQLQRSSERKENSLEEEVMTIEGAAKLLKLSKPAIYTMISSSPPGKYGKKLPFHKKGHKTLYFLRSEIMAWIKGEE